MQLRISLPRRAAALPDPRTSPYTGGEPLPSAEECPNCGDRIPGRFCRHCGQARREVHVSLREMLVDALEDELSLSSRLPRSVAALLFLPGRLTREYLRGRIASYVRPLRLYVGTSVLFFVLFAVVARYGGWMQIDMGPAAAPTPAQGDSLAAAADSARTAADSVLRAELGMGLAGVAPDAAVPLPGAPPAPAAPAAGPGDDAELRITGMGALGDTLNVKLRRFRTMTPAERQKVFLNGMQEELPRMMFLMLPLFALILKLLYVRKKRFYVEHFVFSLHFHAFVFLTLSLVLAVEQLPAARNGPVEPLAVGWIFLYLFVALKRVYGQGIVKTGLKYATLLFSYFILLTFGFVGALIAWVYFL